jgi:hypothetical protein
MVIFILMCFYIYHIPIYSINIFIFIHYKYIIYLCFFYKDACQGPTELKLPKDMDHIEFDFELDLALPLGKFLN